MRLATFLALVVTSLAAHADSEAPNVPVVASGDDGTCYAKSVPANSWGESGSTKVFVVSVPADREVAEYPWYAARIYLVCRDDPTLIRIGRWPQGHKPRHEDLGVAFYLKGKLLRSHSMLDLAGSPENAAGSVSHYMVLSGEFSFQHSESRTVYYFRAGLVTGGAVLFDAFSGMISERVPGG